MLDLPVIDETSTLMAEIEGELDAVDIALIGSAAVVKAMPLQRIRARHHALAKALAEGMRPGIAASTYGYTASRVSILQADPTFKELIEHYRREANHDYARVQERLTGLSIEAIDEMDRRLDEEPEDIPANVLVKMAALGTDRTGHGPKHKVEGSLLIGFSERLNRAREAVKDITPKVPLIEGEVVDA